MTRVFGYEVHVVRLTRAAGESVLVRRDAGLHARTITRNLIFQGGGTKRYTGFRAPTIHPIECRGGT